MSAQSGNGTSGRTNGRTNGHAAVYRYPGAGGDLLAGASAPRPTSPAVEVEAAAAAVATALARLIEAARRPAGGEPPAATVVKGLEPGEVRPILLDVKSAATLLGTSLTTLNKLIYDRKLVSVRVGTRRLIPLAELEAFVAALTEEARAAIAAGRVP